MNQDQYQDKVIEILERIALALESNVKPTLDMVRPLGEYSGFDWRSIGAQPIGHDPDGVTHVLFNGNVYMRRTGNNPNFKPAVWYSRGAGRDELTGQVNYEKLISFEELPQAERITEPTRKVLGSTPDRSNGAPPPRESVDPRAKQDPLTATAQKYSGTPVPIAMYAAIAKGMGFPDEAIQRIPAIMGITDPGGDYFQALGALDVFEAGRRQEMTFADVKTVLEKYQYQAAPALREIEDIGQF
jgi:hypothetical protein